MGGLVDHRRTGRQQLRPWCQSRLCRKPLRRRTVLAPTCTSSNPVASLAYITPETSTAGATPLPSDSRPPVRTAQPMLLVMRSPLNERTDLQSSPKCQRRNRCCPYRQSHQAHPEAEPGSSAPGETVQVKPSNSSISSPLPIFCCFRPSPIQLPWDRRRSRGHCSTPEHEGLGQWSNQ